MTPDRSKMTKDEIEKMEAGQLKCLLSYDPLTGQLRWLCNQPGWASRGRIAGTLTQKGYVEIKIHGRVYRAHRVAWLLMTGRWPVSQIDHIDRCRSNNRWSNLREASNRQNQWNSGPRRHNTSGYKGVSWHRQRQKWQANIKQHGKQQYLGLFPTKEEAYAAYCEATAYRGDFREN